jgi:hypothetical protein
MQQMLNGIDAELTAPGPVQAMPASFPAST